MIPTLSLAQLGRSVLGSAVVGGGPDPHFTSVVLLMHMNGTSGSTSFPEVTGKTVTVFGDAQVTTAQSVFGGASATFDGTGDYLSLADSNDWDFGTGDFTIEARIRFVSSINTFVIASNYGSASIGWFFRAGVSGSDNIQFGSSGDSPINSAALSAGSFVVGTWYAIAVTRESGTVRFFYNGTKVGSDVGNSEDISGSSASLKIASLNGSVQYANGNIDELRITKGVARYTSSYTVAGSAFPDS